MCPFAPNAITEQAENKVEESQVDSPRHVAGRAEEEPHRSDTQSGSLFTSLISQSWKPFSFEDEVEKSCDKNVFKFYFMILLC